MKNNCCPICVRTDQERRLFCGNPDCVCHKSQEVGEELEDIELVDPEKREGMYCESCGRCHIGPCQKVYPQETGWEIGFDKDYPPENINDWTIGIIASTLTHAYTKPRAGEGSDASYLTNKLQKNIHNLLSKRDQYWLNEMNLAIQTDLEAQKQELIKKLEKWIFENHDHHEFTDEKLPDNCQGCEDRNRPYVNSIALEKFIKKLSEEK